MPIQLDTSRRSVASLDLSPENSGIFTPHLESIEFSQAQLRRFNELAQSLNDAMQPLTGDQVAGVARRVIRTHEAGGESPFIRSRLRRAAEMRTMRADRNWALDTLKARRIDDLLAYMDDPNGLFRNDVPVIGLLDDALLVDIAMDDLREDLDDYADYRRFVEGESARRGVSAESLGLTREQWQVERENELKLERQLRRARSSSYATCGVMERVFRVC